MAKKLTHRKVSKYVAEKNIAAVEPLAHLSKKQLENAKSEVRQKQSEADTVPEHIKVIRRCGVSGAIRGYADDDVARLIEAEELLLLEQSQPEVFVSAKTFSAAQSANRREGKREAVIDHDEVIQTAITLGYFDLPKNDRKRRKIRNQIINELSLWFENKATSDDSKDRQMRRILDEK